MNKKHNKGCAAVFLLSLAGMAFGASQSMAETAQVAVAANFTDAAKEIAQAFQQETGHEAVLSFGATGQFYTQITQDAPFDVLLAADNERPQRAVKEGYGVPGSVFSYAIGQLVLYSAQEQLDLGVDYLQSGDFDTLALANPETAPYGAAAMETLAALGLEQQLADKFIQGQNIGQTFQFVQTGNAEVGFVALGQVAQSPTGSQWLVPAQYYQPIEQDAVLLTKAKDNPAALAWMDFLRSDTAVAIIKQYGYAIDDE